MAEFEFSGEKDKDLTKLPGSINGESFSIKDLSNCNVYILDYTSEVEISNCLDCRIFIGPVDGPAIFTGCSGCQVAVVCQQFQAKNCQNIEFGLYCATRPSIVSSHGVRFGAWMGAYPGLAKHFANANLDPKTNLWEKVSDASPDGEASQFELVDNEHYWEVPISGLPLENPVPGHDGKLYVPAANGSAAHDEDTFSAKPVENGNTAPKVPAGENPKVLAMRQKMRERLVQQEEKEAAAKVALAQSAADFLEQFYQRRNVQKDQRAKDNIAAEKSLAVKGPEGASAWERTINTINFNFKGPSIADTSRMKNVLFTAKTKNVPIAKVAV